MEKSKKRRTRPDYIFESPETKRLPERELIAKDLHRYIFTTNKPASFLLTPDDLSSMQSIELNDSLKFASIEIEKTTTITNFKRKLSRTQLIHFLKEAYENLKEQEITQKHQSEMTIETSKRVTHKEKHSTKSGAANKFASKADTGEKHALSIQMCAQGFSHKTIAKLLKVQPRTISVWLQRFKGGKLSVESNTGKNQKCKQIYLDEIEAFLTNPKRVNSSLAEIKRHLISKFELNVNEFSTSTVSRWIRRAGFSYKRMKTYVKDRNSEEQKIKRAEFAGDFAQLLANEKEFIFLDETGFHSAMMPIYGYSKIGKRCYYLGKPKGYHYSVIAAVTKDRLLGLKIVQGSIQYRELSIFLIEILNRIPEILKQRSKYYFVMDNVSTHHAANFLPFAQNLNILYNSTYSPFHNPIEEVFGLWKHYFRKLNFSNPDSVAKNICVSARKLLPKSISKFYRHALKYIALSLAEEDIE